MKSILFTVATILLAGAAPAAAQHLDRHAGPTVLLVSAYQRAGASDQADRLSRKIKIGRDGRFSISNVDGRIDIASGSGDEVEIEAVKRARGARRDLNDVDIDIDARGSRVDVQTRYRGRNVRAWVDYTVTVPASTSVEVKSVSGSVKVTGVQGTVRAESVSGTIVASQTPRLELAKSVSGDLDLADAGDTDLAASSVSGNVRARGFKLHGFDVNTVSGDVVLTDVVCDRLAVRSVSGNLEYAGTLARSGRYDFTSHSGNVRLRLPEAPGFDLTANTFSGAIRSDLPLILGGDASRRQGGRARGVGRRSMTATFGDGSAALLIRTFSGDVVISKR
jgi:DUF4097 and DUF4098 domain-containing protein YvlB